MGEENEVKHGSCRCGEVRFVAKLPVLMTMACHCKGCQKMTGSAFSLSEMYQGGNFEVTDGKPIIGGMKAFPEHNVCPNCASWVFTRINTPAGEYVNVRATMFDQVDNSPPFIETFTQEKLDWVCINAAHGFEKFPPNEEFPLLIAEYMSQSSIEKEAS